ncbi:MAG: class I SAM-dependent methyltransferase [candidate division NC10 bacterium]|nr:class I SAM-dependent methyltransferase [candidate division NC10 bacterium]
MKRYREIYRAGQLPVFQNRMFHSEQEARNCIKGDVVLVQSLETGLIFNQAFRPELMQYDADYQNEQAVSTVFQTHLKDVSEIITKHFSGHSLIEVGCGKGYFLEQLQALGFDITGFDPTYEGSNLRVIKEYFSPAVGLQAEGIILRHVLEHVQDPVGFLSNIRESNGGAGKIYIEVPCFDWICKHRAWFDIFYEHVNYFRLRDFDRMFGRVLESGHTFGGQYLYVVADLATITMPTYDQSDCFEFPEDLLDAISRHANRVKAQTMRDSAVWGGASKGVIFTLFMERAGAKIDIVIDINHAKQDKYLAATGLQVRSPAEAMRMLTHGADVFVMNSNYLNEIQELTAHQFNYLSVEHEDV